MKKILIHSNYHPESIGGIATVVRDLSFLVTEIGHKLSIFCGGDESSIKINEFGWLIIVRKISFKFFGAPILNFGNAKFIKLSLNADLIIYQEPFPLLWPAVFIFNRIFGKKVVVLVHANPVASKYVEMLYSKVRAIVFKGAVIVATSPVLLGQIYGKYSTFSRVLPLAIDDEYLGANLLETSGYGRYVLSIGRFTKYKGLEYLIDAAAQTPEVNYLIVGSGEEARLIMKKIDEMCLKNVYLIDRFVSESEKLALINNCEFFVFPSINRNEAFGIVQLEVMRAGKAIVNTSLGSGVNFVAPDGECAITVIPKNHMELASAIKYLWSNPDISLELGLKGRARFLQFFSKQKFDAEWTSLIKLMLNRNC
jgi:rhamnosyl/mannosyltransferase